MKKSILNYNHDNLRYGKFAHDWYNNLLLTQALKSAKYLKSMLDDIKQLTSKQDLLSIFVLVREYEKQNPMQNSVLIHVDENSASIKINMLPQIIEIIDSYIQKTEFENAKLEIYQLQLMVNLDFAYEKLLETENMGYGIDILHAEILLNTNIQDDDAPKGEMEVISAVTIANSAAEGQDTEPNSENDNSDTDTEILRTESDNSARNQDKEITAINNMSEATIMMVAVAHDVTPEITQNMDEKTPEISQYLDESSSKAKNQKQDHQNLQQHGVNANLENAVCEDINSSWIIADSLGPSSQLPTITEEYFTKESHPPEESTAIEAKLAGESSSNYGIDEKDSNSPYSCSLQ